jgi:hypothetical protein
MAQAGYLTSISAATASGGTYSTVGGMNSTDFEQTRDALDDTEFGDTHESAFAGLKKTNFNLAGDFVASDAGQAILDAAFSSGNTVYVKYLRDGSDSASGYVIPVKVIGRKESSTPAGKIPLNYTFKVVAEATASS